MMQLEVVIVFIVVKVMRAELPPTTPKQSKDDLATLGLTISIDPPEAVSLSCQQHHAVLYKFFQAQPGQVFGTAVSSEQKSFCCASTETPKTDDTDDKNTTCQRAQNQQGTIYSCFECQ